MILRPSSTIGALLGATALAMAVPAWPAGPRIPDSDDAVLEWLPSRPSDPSQRQLRRLRAALAEDPGDPERAVALARHHFAIAQADGDPRQIGYGEAALRGVPEHRRTPELLVVGAQLAQYQHDFSRAHALLDRALAAAPSDPEALAWKTALHLVQADYAAAGQACERLANAASELLGTACRAQIGAATGSLRASYESLRAALAGRPDARPSLRQWVSVLLADMAQRLGRARDADAHYRAALALDDPDQYLLAAYAEFLIDERRPSEAAALLRGRERSDTLLLLIARAHKALGSPETARLTELLRARYADAARRGSRLHAQDEARFRLEFLTDAAGAADLAAQNWADQQREAADARVLMEAALAAKTPRAARPALAWLAATGFEDARLSRLAAALKALEP